MAAGRFLPLLLLLLLPAAAAGEAGPGPGPGPDPEASPDHGPGPGPGASPDPGPGPGPSGRPLLAAPEPAAPGYDELCAAPPDAGPCRAAFPRWAYSPAARRCRRFLYGGCRGNRNNHPSPEECLRRCRPPPDPSEEFFSPKALTLGVLLALLAVALLGCAADLALRRCRRCRPREPPAPGTDKEQLMGPGLLL